MMNINDKINVYVEACLKDNDFDGFTVEEIREIVVDMLSEIDEI